MGIPGACPERGGILEVPARQVKPATAVQGHENRAVSGGFVQLKLFARLLAILLVLGTLPGCPDDSADGKPCRSVDGGRDARWRADIDCALSLIDAHHPAPYAYVAEAGYDAAAQSLKDAVPRLSTAEIIAELMIMVSFANDIHTRLHPSPMLLPAAPVKLQRFDDGIFATRVPMSDAAAVGDELIAVNGLAMNDVLHALAPLSPAETPAMRADESTELLVFPALLQARGVASDASYSLVSLAGGSEMSIESGTTVTEFAVAPDPESANLPLSFTNRDRAYWAEVVPELRLLYVQYNLCFEDGMYPMETLAMNVGEMLDAGGVDRVLVDVRYNPGGIARVIDPLKSVLASKAVAAGMPVHVAIGPRTFSAAIQNAIEFREELGAVLIGNETTELANHTGNVRFFVLPNTGNTLSVGSVMLENEPGNDGALAPDIALPRLGTDYVNGVDPVLEWFEVN